MKRLNKRVIGKIAKISGELPSGFAEEVLEKISAAACIRMFDDRVACTRTLRRRHKENFASLLQHMAYSCKALFANVGDDLLGHHTNQQLFLEYHIT